MRPLNYIFRNAKGHHPRGYCTVLLPKKGYYPLKSVSSLLFSNRFIYGFIAAASTFSTIALLRYPSNKEKFIFFNKQMNIQRLFTSIVVKQNKQIAPLDS